jgi:WD40 repeat protein
MRRFFYGILMVLVVASSAAHGEQPLRFVHDTVVAPMPWTVLSPDGKTLAVPVDGGDVFLWNVQTQAKHRLVKGYAIMEGEEARVSTVQFSPDSQKLATVDHVRGIVRVWKFDDRGQAKLWKTLRVAMLTEEGVSHVEFTSKGEELIVASRFLVLPNKLKADGSGKFDFDEEGKEPYGLAYLIRKYGPSHKKCPIGIDAKWA